MLGYAIGFFGGRPLVTRLGRYVLTAVPGSPVTREQLVAAVTLADQAGAALGLEAAAAVTSGH